MVKFGNRGGNVQRGGGDRSHVAGGFKRRGAAEGGRGGRRFSHDDEGGDRRGGRGGRGGERRGKPMDHASLDEDMLKYWDKAGVKDKRKSFSPLYDLRSR